jgi:class 3 adenylate cyclase/tetratricopeptide (TPR) repeat protein
MQCPRCQHENREGRRFCAECGAALALACSSCGFANEPDEKFCGGCGLALGAPSPAAQAPAPAEPRFASPQTYTPPHLAERILTSRGALEGERKQVTVLFADLKGSMELLADRDPEDARRILDPVLERMMEAVHRYEGTVNQVMGDGIMALFGAPLAHEDHAVRACYAALRMQESVQQYAADALRTDGVRIQIRVGLNSGEVVVRSIGSDLHMDYTAVGQTTHLAARMEQTAVPGSILIAPDTLRLAEGYVHVHALGPIPIKGLDAPVEAYEVLGAGTSRTRLQAAAARGFTRFVGRETEIETLRQTLERAGQGHGQIVALVGEPGVGKSRLVWEFTHSHRAQGWLLLESGSVSYGKATSWLPVSDLLRTYCHVEAADDPRRIRQKVLGKVLDLDRALEPTLPALLGLLDVPVDDPAWDALDPPQRRQRTLDAVKRLLLRESQVQPLLLVCEDLHWIDAETQALLDSLVESLPTARLLLLVNYRPEYEHGWGRKTYYRPLRLDPLPPDSAEELLGVLVGDDARLESLKRLLIERTDGNPFFLEESVHALVETGALAGERGAYHLAKPIGHTQVPATVQAVLAARIDRLAPEDKRLLQAAAVVGKDVPYALLQAIAELPGERLREGLGRLQDAEFLYEASLFPDLEYTFKHALTHEVAYGSPLGERRRALHARIVTAVEGLYPDRLGEHVERLAHHALHGEIWEKAVTYFRQAGMKAATRSALREAAAYFEQGLVALAHLQDSRDTREQAVDLRLDLSTALNALAQFTEALDCLRAAEALADALGDERRLARVYVRLSNAIRMMGDSRRAAVYAQRGVDLATASGDVALRGLACFFGGLAYWGLGDYRAAVDYLRQAVTALTGEWLYYRASPGMGTLSIACRRWLVVCLGEVGECAEAAVLAEEAGRLAEGSNQPWDLADAGLSVGVVHLLQGAAAAAVPPLERSLAVCEAADIPLYYPQIVLHLGQAYALSGRLDEALRLAERTGEQPGTLHQMAPPHRANRLAWLGDVSLLAGRREAARSNAERALVLTRESGYRGVEAGVLRLLGEIAAHADPPEIEHAEGYYRQALALAEELGMRPLQAHCHLGLGTLYQRAGRRDQARAELTAALDLYRDMEMAFWLQHAEDELAQIGH